jgi:myo-inositol-1(or 4)-monophosphatase
MSAPSVTGLDALLRESLAAARAAFVRATTTLSRDQRGAVVGIGGDGTPTHRFDVLVEAPVLDVLERARVNVLSEEVGWIDRGSACTVVIDPLDGTANAVAGVPLSSFSAALVRDGVVIEALAHWFEGDRTWHVRADDAQRLGVTARRSLRGASVSMLRPRPETSRAWNAVAQQADRVRVLGTSVLEACLVVDGAIDAFCDPGGEVHRIVDLAAADLLVRKAGGCLRDVRGRPLNFEPDLRQRWSGIVASSAQLADDIATVVSAA